MTRKQWMFASDPQRSTYTWNTTAWPNLTYDAQALQRDFERVTSKVGELTGLRASLSPRDKALSYVNEVADEAVSSYAIERKTLDRDALTKSVIASILKRDAKDAAGQYRNVAEIMLEARDPEKPLSLDRLNAWHRKMFEHDRLAMDGGHLRRDEMQVVTMRNGQVHRVHFEAPPPERLEADMVRFIAWLDRTGPRGEEAGRHATPARAALAHLKFETIHPYSDGNGRIGRAVADHVASESPTYSRAPFSLSRIIQQEKKGYYDALQGAQTLEPNQRGEIDATKFVRWFTNAMERGVERARDEALFLVARNSFFDRHGDALNNRQERVLRRLFDEGKERVEQGISAKPYMKISGASPASATRDLKDLAEKGIVSAKPGGGRNTAYSLNVSFVPRQSPRADLKESQLVDERETGAVRDLTKTDAQTKD